MDFRDPFVEVEESAGNVTLCVYICDGVLKRNAIFTFATEDVIATCESRDLQYRFEMMWIFSTIVPKIILL